MFHLAKQPNHFLLLNPLFIVLPFLLVTALYFENHWPATTGDMDRIKRLYLFCIKISEDPSFVRDCVAPTILIESSQNEAQINLCIYQQESTLVSFVLLRVSSLQQTACAQQRIVKSFYKDDTDVIHTQTSCRMNPRITKLRLAIILANCGFLLGKEVERIIHNFWEQPDWSSPLLFVVLYCIRLVVILPFFLSLTASVWYSSEESTGVSCRCVETPPTSSLFRHVVCILFHTPRFIWRYAFEDTPPVNPEQQEDILFRRSAQLQIRR
jgi:hypothetical protein